MDLDAYVGAHRRDWDRLEALVKRASSPRRLAEGEVDELVELYQRTARLDLDNYNADAAAAQYGEMLGIPADLMYDDEVVAEIRQARAKQQQQEEMAAMMQRGAQGVKTLSEADTGENNALGALLGGIGGGGGQ